MLHKHLDQSNAESVALVTSEDEYIAEPAKCCEVGDHSREPDLIAIDRVHAADESAICDGLCDRVFAPVKSPIGLARQILVDEVDIDIRSVCAEVVLTKLTVHRGRLGAVKLHRGRHWLRPATVRISP